METAKHQFYMMRCIELAQAAKRQGESPVGSILVKDGEIIAEAMEAVKKNRDITCHAEIEVIRNLRHKVQISDLSAYTMYTTHEPCIMCSYVIRHHRIGTIVWGVSTGEIGGQSSAFNILQDETIRAWGSVPKVITGILMDTCKELHNRIVK